MESTSQYSKQMLENDSGAVFCSNVLFFTKIEGKKGKKAFLMHCLSAVAGQLVKDRQMLPNRDFSTR